MLDNKHFLSKKRKHLLFGLVLLLLFSGICLAFGPGENEEFELARKEVLLRKIGHELLLQSGDSTSRVLPVQKTADNEYQIRFANKLSFQPDSLMNLAQRLLAAQGSDYVVNVLQCSGKEVFYAFAISKKKSNNIVTCSKRMQPAACYVINIKFKPASGLAVNKGYLWGGLPLLAFVGLIFLRSSKTGKASKESSEKLFNLGSVLFDAKEKRLIVDNKTTQLTGTETRLLLIFATSPNETIARARLQKEIWEDEGVIVGRSLDMFISKLRKKLETDSQINIVVVRGKGYKLQINT